MKWKVASLFAIALHMGCAASAFAEGVFVTQLDDHEDHVAVTGFAFGTNQTPRRAWLNLSVSRREDPAGPGDIGDENSVVRAYVPGLSRIDDRIVFTGPSRVTVCATVVHKRLLFIRYDAIEETGRCAVSTTPGFRRKDDGFVVTTVPVLNVYFNVRE